MNTQEKIVYTEVYNILELLGKEYINRLPKSLYAMIEKNSKNIRNLKYKSLKDINKDNVLKKSIAMIALFHTNYWCDSEEEKEELKQIFSNNFINNEKEKREKFNPDDIFKKRLNEKEEKKTEIIEYKEPSIWRKIFDKINYVVKKLIKGRRQN